MMDFNTLMQMIGDTFFGGDVTLAGMAVFSLAIMVVLALTRKAFVTMVVALPLAFIFNQLNVLSSDLMILLIIVAVLGMAMTSRNVWKD